MSQKKNNKAVVLHGSRDLRLESFPLPSLKDDEVLIEMQAIGICGSDVHYYAHGRCGPFVVNGPLVLGHESSGKIVEVGAKVTHLQAGDRVAIEPGVPCRYCEQCKAGKYNLCKDVVFLATPPVHGSIANYIVHASDFCYKLPEGVSYEEGALLEPLSVGLQACDRAKLFPGASVLILGAGPIGLVTLLACQANGATTTALIDINQDRLKLAKTLGATFTLSANLSLEESKKILGREVDVCFDCSGAEAAIRKGAELIKPGGKLVLIGRGPKVDVSLPLFGLSDKEIDVVGVFRYRHRYPRALELIATGQIDVKPLVSHHFGLDQVKEAFDVTEHARDNVVKAMIHPSVSSFGSSKAKL